MNGHPSDPRPITVVIADDQTMVRSGLRMILDAQDGIEVVGEAADGAAAIKLVEELDPDVVLMDIRMPQMDGIELAQHLASFEQAPSVIFATAYDSYAVQAFELNAVDYLLKPVRTQRLLTALGKLPSRPPPAEMLRSLQPEGRTHLSCHERGRLLLIPVAEVLYLKADLKYVMARTREREYLLDESLTHLESEFAERFIRLHRAVLVARAALAGFERAAGDDADAYGWALLRDVPEKLPVSRRQWVPAKALLTGS